MKQCLYCGASFGKHPRESKRQWAARRFCGRKCAGRWLSENHESRRARGVCAACGRDGTFHADGLCRRCWDKRRYAEQRERILENNRRWREANRDYWRQPHIAERVRRWHAEHPERVREITRAALRRRRARLMGASIADPKLTNAYIAVLAGDPCSYCGEPSEHIDHIVPISRGGGHVWDNVTSACAGCNLSKNRSTLLDFLLRRQPPQTGQGVAPSRS